MDYGLWTLDQGSVNWPQVLPTVTAHGNRSSRGCEQTTDHRPQTTDHRPTDHRPIAARRKAFIMSVQRFFNHWYVFASLIAWGACAADAQDSVPAESGRLSWAIAVHGGAGGGPAE